MERWTVKNLQKSAALFLCCFALAAPQLSRRLSLLADSTPDHRGEYNGPSTGVHPGVEREAPMSQAVVAKLFDLQQLDLDIDRVLTEIEATRRALAEDATKPARDAATRAKRQAGEARRAAREAENSVHEAEARIQKQEKRLYAGETPVRDLAALQTELAHLRTAHTTQEEQVLTLMLAAEEAEGAAARAAEALQAAEHDWEQQKAHHLTHMGTLESSLAALRAQHDAQAAAIDADAVRRYDTIRRTHGGRGVAVVQGGTCQVCRVAVTSGALQRARSGTELVPCNNCGRILYVR
jgi:predicted  nucleic acid-binding Zn-ribbon protein